MTSASISLRCAFSVRSSGSPGPAPTSETRPAGGEAAKLWPGFPRQDQKLVAEIVGVSHFNEQRVRELVKSCPELVNAWWDWGFGDWESPLGAASHTGQREIAEVLVHFQVSRIFAIGCQVIADILDHLVSHGTCHGQPFPSVCCPARVVRSDGL